MSVTTENTTNTTGYTAPPAEKVEAASNVDDFGYDIPKEEAEPTVIKTEKTEPVAEPEEEEVKDPATGYSVNEPPAPKEEAEPVKEEPKKEAAPADELEIKEVGELLPDEIKELKAFAKDKKLTKEAFESLVEFKKNEVKKAQEYMSKREKEAVASAAKLRHDWHTELKNDPTFGGNNFDHSLKRVEKILADHLPNVKKKLTETNGILPPYIMKDLATLANHIYSTKKMVQGDKIETKVTEEETNNPLAFYEQ